MYANLYFEDYVPGSARTTYGRTVTAADLAFHQRHLGGEFPPLSQAETAALSGAAPQVAPGTLVFTVAIGLTALSAPINGAAFTYGYDRLQFPHPVRTGDTLHVRVSIASCAPDPKRPDHGRVVEACETTNQHGQTVFTCDHLLLVQRRSQHPEGGKGNS